MSDPPLHYSLLYLSSPRDEPRNIHVFHFERQSNAFAWQEAVDDLKLYIAGINEEHGKGNINQIHNWILGLQNWLCRYNWFLLVYKESKVPADVLRTKNDIVEGFTAAGIEIPTRTISYFDAPLL